MAGPDMTGHAWDAGAPGRAFVAQHGLEASVRFIGPLSDVAPMIQAADLVVQPSHFEALGLSAIEALACGVPLVASAVGGLLDFVVDGDNGLSRAAAESDGAGRLHPAVAVRRGSAGASGRAGARIGAAGLRRAGGVRPHARAVRSSGGGAMSATARRRSLVSEEQRLRHRHRRQRGACSSR